MFDEPGGSSPTGGFTLAQVFQKRACLADAIITGSTTNWVHHLSYSGSAVYADYDFVIGSILKDNKKASLLQGTDIVVTRPGGSLDLGQGSLKTVDFEDERFPHLQRNQTYLLFLRFIPQSGGYEAVDYFSTFSLRNNQWVLGRKAYQNTPLPIPASVTLLAFISS